MTHPLKGRPQTPEHIARRSAALMGYRYTDAPKYGARHYRVRTARGKASEHRCIDCGEQARDWAQIHGRDGLDVFDYQPMCRRCHQVYDDIPARSAATQLAKR